MVESVFFLKMLNNGNKDNNDDNRIIRISKLIIIEDEN